MKSLKKTLIAAVAATAFGACGVAQAGVVIDLFSSATSQSVTDTTVDGTAVTTQNAIAYPTTSVIGGYRDLSINKTADTVGEPISPSTLEVNGGALQFSNAVGNQSVGVVTWDGSNDAGQFGSNVLPTGFGGTGIDLTVGGAANTFLAEVIAADIGFGYKIRVWDMDGDMSELTAGVQFKVVPSAGATAHYDFGWFNLVTGTYCDGSSVTPCADPLTQLDFSIVRSGGLIDFTRIGALQLELFNATDISADFALGKIESIPEPGALALAGLALVGAAAAGRRRFVKN